MNSFGNEEYEQFSSEVHPGRGTTVVWNLSSLRGSEEDLSFLHSHASCFVNLPAGEEGPTTRLRFYFQETTLHRSEPNIGPNCPQGHFINFNTTWLSLWVEQVVNETGQAVKYEIKVDLLDEKGVAAGNPYSVLKERTLWRSDPDPDPCQGPKAIPIPTHKKVVEENFIRLKQTVENTFTGKSTTEKFRRPGQLRLRISVKPFYIHERSPPAPIVEGDGAGAGDVCHPSEKIPHVKENKKKNVTLVCRPSSSVN